MAAGAVTEQCNRALQRIKPSVSMEMSMRVMLLFMHGWNEKKIAHVNHRLIEGHMHAAAVHHGGAAGL